MLNEFKFIGNLTKKPELRKVQTKNGDEINVTTLTIAVDRRRSGLTIDGTDFFDVTVWGKTAENCFNYLNKGSRVLAMGYITINSFEKDGQRRFYTQFTSQRVVFLSRLNDSNNNQNNNNTPNNSNTQNNNSMSNTNTNLDSNFIPMGDEIPF